MPGSAFGVPEDEADLFSYPIFDCSFARLLIELGRADSSQCEDEIVDFLANSPAASCSPRWPELGRHGRSCPVPPPQSARCKR
jgi:hypothetical protein